MEKLHLEILLVKGSSVLKTKKKGNFIYMYTLHTVKLSIVKLINCFFFISNLHIQKLVQTKEEALMYC